MACLGVGSMSYYITGEKGQARKYIYFMIEIEHKF